MKGASKLLGSRFESTLRGYPNGVTLTTLTRCSSPSLPMVRTVSKIMSRVILRAIPTLTPTKHFLGLCLDELKSYARHLVRFIEDVLLSLPPFPYGGCRHINSEPKGIASGP